MSKCTGQLYNLANKFAYFTLPPLGSLEEYGKEDDVFYVAEIDRCGYFHFIEKEKLDEI